MTASSDTPANRSVISSSFNAAAQWTSRQCGRASTFAIACLTILVWALSGPLFHYSDTWQLVINTGTTIITFLMVFLIQNTQNRDSAALHLKLDELIRVSNTARNKLLNLENLTEAELDHLKDSFTKMADERESQTAPHEGAAGDDAAETGTPEAKAEAGTPAGKDSQRP
jgi:low affinity Fe/Cu permease